MWFLGLSIAPSDNKSEEKYKDWPLEELKTECKKREIEFKETTSIKDLISLLVEDDNTPRWGEIYSRLLYHTGMNYEEVARRTLKQISAILDGAGENISLKIGLPYNPGFTENTDNEIPKEVDNGKRLSQLDQIERMFNM